MRVGSGKRGNSLHTSSQRLYLLCSHNQLVLLELDIGVIVTNLEGGKKYTDNEGFKFHMALRSIERRHLACVLRL